jgi:GMP synthase-like glutamine amidotransferase
MPRALLVANQDLQAGGYVVDELERHGFTFEPVLREDATWPALDRADLVVVLGSDWHAHDVARSEQVAEEVTFVRSAHDRGTPVFGICYGAQMLARALGGAVRPADAIELGWLEVEPLHPAIPSGPWMQWHSDTFSVPDGAELLARSPIGPQALRAGRSFAVQFHLEVDADMVAAWVKDGGGRDLHAAGMDGDELVARSRELTPRSEPAARALVDWFLRDVAAT